MTDTILRIEQIEEDILANEVSDEALETAAGTRIGEAAHYTLGACTGISVCPGF
jgi:hypothetical protein